MLEEIAACVRGGESFAFETTLSGKGYLRHIPQWQATGYHVSLFFLALPDEESAIARVAERVRQGGHAIPEAVIRRRLPERRRPDYPPRSRISGTTRRPDWSRYDAAPSGARTGGTRRHHR